MDEEIDDDMDDTLTQAEYLALREERFQEQYCSGISNESLGLCDRDFF
jgi:hypothetical protein